MRLNLKFELNKPIIDIEYRKMFISYFKYCLNDVDEKYFKQYYNNTDKKTFTFGCYLQGIHQTESNDMFELDSNILSLNISFDDKLQGYLFYSCFLRQRDKLFNIKNNQMKLIEVKEIHEKSINDNCVIIKTLSPICLLDHEKGKHDQYYTINDENFFEKFKEKTSVEIQLLDSKKIVIQHYGIFIPCSVGTFILIGNQNKLMKLYRSGIGNKTGQGFGMIDII